MYPSRQVLHAHVASSGLNPQVMLTGPWDLPSAVAQSHTFCLPPGSVLGAVVGVIGRLLGAAMGWVAAAGAAADLDTKRPSLQPGSQSSPGLCLCLDEQHASRSRSVL